MSHEKHNTFDSSIQGTLAGLQAKILSDIVMLYAVRASRLVYSTCCAIEVLGLEL